MGGIAETLKRARYLPPQDRGDKIAKSAFKTYLRTIASRPDAGPLTGEALAMLEHDYGHKKLSALIVALAQIHPGRITKNMVIGQANRLGLKGRAARRRLLTAKL